MLNNFPSSHGKEMAELGSEPFPFGAQPMRVCASRASSGEAPNPLTEAGVWQGGLQDRGGRLEGNREIESRGREASAFVPDGFLDRC